MTLPLRLFYIAVLHVILTSFATYILVSNEYRELSKQNVEALERFLILQKEQELKNYTSIAMSTIDKINQQYDGDIKITKPIVANILESMLYNEEDGYFFVYDKTGLGIVHPKEPYRVGKPWWDLEDGDGNKVIQMLLTQSDNGGGFIRYNWNKPSEKIQIEKMSYARYIGDWDWMLGTGVYLDDVYAQLGKIQTEINTHINNTEKIILIIAISSIFFIFIFGIGMNLNHKKRAEKKINELGQRVVDVQEEENRHISRELHDGIIQTLVSIKFSLEATGMFLSRDKQAKPEPLIQAENNLNIAIQEVRRISHHMHPQILDELGLSAAIDSLAQDFTQRTNVQIHFEKPVLRKLLPDFINTTLFRVVQESLINIQKHANAQNVEIKLSIQSNWLTLSIKDDGRGFKVPPNEEGCDSGIGLRNLAERVEYNKGKFSISSSSHGTQTDVKIPTASFVNHFNQSTMRSDKNDNV